MSLCVCDVIGREFKQLYLHCAMNWFIIEKIVHCILMLDDILFESEG